MTRRPKATYRFDFALTVLVGNLTRYLVVRPIVEADPEVRARWYPIRSWVHGDWMRIFPDSVRLRLRHLADSWKLYVRRPADAVVIHALETYNLYGFWNWLLRLRTVIVDNSDDARMSPNNWLSRRFHLRALERTALFLPWSSFVADQILESYPQAADRMRVLHPGLPLERWSMRTPPAAHERFRILFVGGKPAPKGLPTLLDALDVALGQHCDLHVVTQSLFLEASLRARLERRSDVELFLDLTPGSPELVEQYEICDAFVLPTERDMSPWVVLEAMATGLPVVVSGIGGIPDMVQNGTTGLLIEPGDVAAVVEAVERLRTSPELVRDLAKHGREHVECQFDARTNTAMLLSMTKDLVDERRRPARRRGAPA